MQHPVLIQNLHFGCESTFLGPKDAEYVLTELWGNPEGYDTLGMIFPSDETPEYAPWGIEITYDAIGYVSDEDAEDYNYDDVLKVMREDIADENIWRVQNGYERMELIGWAAPPHYDPEGRKLHWAKELKFADSETNTLNYNLRVLGRKGVLIMNFIARMDQLQAVEAAAPDVMAMTEFNPGNRYAEFDPSIDKVAAVGIGGLIAGKVITKTGFLAVALVFLKKFWFVLLLPLIWLKNLFTRKDPES